MASLPSRFSARFKELADLLPFAIDDADRVNATYVRWAEARDAEAKRVIDVWTYCFVYRYFVRKAVRGDVFNPTDVEALVARTYRRVDEGRAAIKQPGRYVQWVSVVCRNRFLNHVRAQRRDVSLDDEAVREPVDDRGEAHVHLGFVHEALEEALGRLPDYLAATARLLFLEECSYEEAAEALGKSVPTVRVYKQRAVHRLREDPALSSFWDTGGH
jgi:RNA polymerase sigma factor (sigma-70 family)